MKKALVLGILASLFFAFTFVFNRSINLGGGYWLWSAALRYIFTLPIMGALLLRKKETGKILTLIKGKPFEWILWSTVGFGLFYMPLTMASVYGESWFVAATWQITIVCGIFLTPLFGKKIPFKNLMFSIMILIGIVLLQISHLNSVKTAGMLTSFLLILIAAFSYPLGNRKMMTVCTEDVSTIGRVFGMTLCSMPFWIVMSVIAYVKSGFPSSGQVIQSLIVALFSGVIATVLFFEATNLVKTNPKQLAVIEATQSGEVIFTLLGGLLFLGDQAPSVIGFLGIVIIIAGMILNSFASAGK